MRIEYFPHVTSDDDLVYNLIEDSDDGDSDGCDSDDDENDDKSTENILPKSRFGRMIKRNPRYFSDSE